MSYLVLARKYRPGNFAEMVGQDHVVTALSNALSRLRLHHAYLFTGTRGVGKTTVARILAKSLNCVGPDGAGSITATPCGLCQTCRDIDEGRFADYTELDAASNRGVDEIQSLLEQSAYKPVQGRFKVFMIDEVHMLSNTAFNAMLKTLEEPPPYLKFILATTDPQKVPVTVLSRCLQFSLRPIAPETICEHLAKVLQQERVQADTNALRLLARSARGSMRDALSLTDQAIAFGDGSVQETKVREMLGSADRARVIGLLAALADGNGRELLAGVDALRREGQNPGSVLEDMVLMLQRIAVRQAIGIDAAKSVDPGVDPDEEELDALALRLDVDETQLLYSICLHGRGELGLAPDEYAALAMLLLRQLAFKPSAGDPRRFSSAPGTSGVTAATIESPKQVPVVADARALLQMKVRELPDQGAVPFQATALKEAREASELIAVPVLQAQEGGARTELRRDPIASSETFRSSNPDLALEADYWFKVVQQLMERELISALTRELALGAQLMARDRDHWMLRVERETLNQASSRERLRNALRELGHEVEISVEVGMVRDSPGRRLAHAKSERLRAAEETILADPFVQEMMRDFGAKIVPGSIQAK